MKGVIFFVERNIHGAWIIYGLGGVRQYYGYTKAAAVAKYKKDNPVFVDKPERGRGNGGG